MRISEILSGGLVDPEAHLDASRVERYEEEPGDDPVVVFRTPEGLLLADGYHRVAAAQRRGETTIEADVREGSRRDALAYAIEVGAAQRGLTRDEALERIKAHSHGRRDR